jgi:ADP-glucose pyrophosphorylase
VPFAGKYRVIDFTLANCLHSGLRQVLVLTQYKSHSLHKHLRDAWSLFNAELGEFITAGAAADARRQRLVSRRAGRAAAEPLSDRAQRASRCCCSTAASSTAWTTPS